ncbi:ribonuclease H-like domain-containing protein [Tanacetum coccineum]
MFLTQSKYVEELRERADMLHCNPYRTPMDTKSKLGPHGDPIFDPTLYRSLDGGLQYLTFTHPNISYVVKYVCLYMHDPCEPYYIALKRILHYIRDTIDHGIELHVSSMTQLTTYTDATGHVTLSHSSVEAKHRGVANVVIETAWLRNLYMSCIYLCLLLLWYILIMSV